jgi:hypothetical protein
MELLRQIDGYCERTDFTYWSEPLNAVTNLSFILAALILWPRVRGIPGAQILVVILFVIGVGSYLFHTHATVWAAMADTIPIGLFILTYLFLVNLNILRWPLWAALLGTLAFLPYAYAVTSFVMQMPFLRVSSFYWSVPLLLVIYAFFLKVNAAGVSRGFLIGAGLLAVSLTFRSLDKSLCSSVPVGTHFLWHLLNGVMLGWMIVVYRRHMLASASQGG